MTGSEPVMLQTGLLGPLAVPDGLGDPGKRDDCERLQVAVTGLLPACHGSVRAPPATTDEEIARQAAEDPDTARCSRPRRSAPPAEPSRRTPTGPARTRLRVIARESVPASSTAQIGSGGRFARTSPW